jgi:8-oxo-dGTP pyrophosphatase MutT (NUDIX family)
MGARPEGGAGGARFERIAEDVVYSDWLSFVLPRFRAPDGSEFTRAVVRHPGAVSVVPLLDDGESVLMVRQFRPALNRYLMEIPAGKRDVDGEEPSATAHRELVEEVGMRAGRLDPLCNFFNSPGFCDEHQFLFLARDLEACAVDSQSVEEEYMTVESVRLGELPQLIATGVVADAKSIIGLLMTREFLATGH